MVRLQLVVNNNLESGFNVVEGRSRSFRRKARGKSASYFSVTVSGTVMLKAADFINIWVFSSGDSNYNIHTQSGFSCHQLTESSGFHAVKSGSQDLGPLWTQVTGWRVGGTRGLYSFGDSFNTGTGVFAAEGGAYYCAAQVLFDRTDKKGKKDGPPKKDDPKKKDAPPKNDAPAKKDDPKKRHNPKPNTRKKKDDIRLHLRVDENEEEYGLSTVGSSDMPNNMIGLNVAGTVALKSGQRVSMWAYSDAQTRVIQDSGFSCHRMGAYTGFHANLAQDKRYRTGWSTLKGWQTWGHSELYSWGGRPGVDGDYEARISGFYVCAAQVGW